jgi:hypothetical protein
MPVLTGVTMSEMSKSQQVIVLSDPNTPLPDGIVSRTIWTPKTLHSPGTDFLAEEVPVALVYNGISHVVMMASPKDLELFAIGFSFGGHH